MINPQFINQSKVAMPKAFLKVWVQAVCEQLPRADQKRVLNKEVSVVFLDTTAARHLNQQYRQRDYATDVLSFAGDGDEHLGDLAICPQVVRRQAKEHSLSFRAELGYMVLHGILHLLGYDHEGKKSEAERMFRLQDRIFAKLQHLLT